MKLLQIDSSARNKRYAYNASKAALNLLTIPFAQELEGTKIKVTRSIRDGSRLVSVLTLRRCNPYREDRLAWMRLS